MNNADKMWNIFKKSGKIEDYLEYKKLDESSTFKERN